MGNMDIWCIIWSDKALKGIVVNQNIIYFYAYSFSEMQCNACERKMQADVILKEPLRGDTRRGGGKPPPLVRPCTFLKTDYFQL